MATITPKSIRTSGLIYDTAIAELSANGLDHVTFTTIARNAGLTTGAMYSRFENSAELLVALWEERLAPTLREFVNCYDACVIDSADSDALKRLSLMVSNPSPALLLAAEAVAIAPRVEELFEVVAPDIADILRSAPELKAMRFGEMTIVLGALLYFPFSSARKFVPTVVENAVRIGRVSSIQNYGPLTHVDIQTYEGDPEGTDPLIRDLLIATRTVIGKSGFERATVSRIARMWGHNSATIYQYFENKSELMASTVQHALRSSLIMRQSEPSPKEFVSSGAQTITNHLTEDRRPYLRFRLEAHVAALHQDEIAKVMRKEYARYRDRMLANTSLPRGITTAASEASNAAYVGRAMLFPFVPDLGTYDWRPYTESLIMALMEIFTLAVK